jgi:selenocysteine-specific elongation factor
LERPIIARRGDRFVIRSYSPLTTIGGGRVLSPFVRKRVSIDSARRELLEVLDGGTTGEIIESLVRDRKLQGYPKSLLPIDTGRVPGEITSALDTLRDSGRILGIKERLFHDDSFDSMLERISRALARYHKENPLQLGVNREELRHRIGSRASGLLMDDVLSRLVHDGRIALEGGEYRLITHSISLDRESERLAEAIISLLSKAPLSPPDLPRIASELEVDRSRIVKLLSTLQRLERVVKVDENIWLVAEGIREARDRVVNYLQDRGEATASEIRGELQISRKYAIPILEHLDRIGVTYRRGDKRFLAQT